MRLFLDANILFSAAKSSTGRAATLFALVGGSASPHTLLASPHAITEAERNIQIKHPDRLGELRSLIEALSITAEASAAMVRWAADQGLPPPDAPILAAAVQAKADVLVTGDRTHFGHLYGRRLRAVEIIPLSDALALML